jgi:fibronectin-binding autotransporter adhesin
LIVSNLANGGSVSDIGAANNGATNLVLNGGRLQYLGNAANIDRLFSVGTGGGTIDSSGSGALALIKAGSIGLTGSGTHVLTLTGTLVDTNTLSANIADSSGGSTALTKSGAGKWILTGTNTYSGATTIQNGGTLQVGTGGGSATVGSGNIAINNSSQLDFNNIGTVTVSGIISGNGSLTNDGTGKTILANNNTYTGDTVINAGTLQLGNGGGTGSLAGSANITNNSMLIFNSTANSTYTGGGIHGTGNVEIKSGTVKAVANNDYTGWTLIDSGATFTPDDNNTGNPGILSSSVVTNNGTLRLEGYTTRTPYYGNIVGTGKVQVGATGANFDQGDEVLAGTNTYTGGSYIGETHLVLGDGATPGAGSIVGNVYFVNNFEDSGDGGRRLIFNRPFGDDFTFSGNIVTNFSSPQGNLGIVQQNGSDTITLTGANTYGGGTVIDAGALQVGNGGTSGTISRGQVTDNGILFWNHSDNVTFPRQITGTGSFVQFGSGTLTLSSTNIAYTGATTISNGTLVISGQITNGLVGVGGDLDLEGGTLIPGGAGSVVTMNVGGSVNIDAGTVEVSIDRNLASTVTNFQVATFAINYTGGNLKLLNAGAPLQIGDKFYIFSAPVNNGAGMTIVSPGFTVTNNLADDGSVTVIGVQPPPTITATVSGNQLNLSWPSAWTGGVHLQSQTNSLSVGLSSNWVTIPGTDASNTYSATINKANGSVFYRLITP